MEPNVFLEYLVWDIVSVLNSFGHEQYPSKSNIDPQCLITEYPNEGIGFFVDFGRAMQYPITYQNMLWSPMYLWNTSKRVLQVY